MTADPIIPPSKYRIARACAIPDPEARLAYLDDMRGEMRERCLRAAERRARQVEVRDPELAAAWRSVAEGLR